MPMTMPPDPFSHKPGLLRSSIARDMVKPAALA